MSSLGIVTAVLASDVADDGTVAVAYPTGQTKLTLTGSVGGDLTINDGAGGIFEQADPGFSVSYGASTITITNLSGLTWPSGATLRLSLGTVPRNGSYNLTVGGADGQANGPSLRTVELTATGAIPAGTQATELNHASVIIAATYAVEPNTVRIFKDTSATGTAAHTVTLTGGTFDGTHTIATFNLRDDFIMIAFDSAGRGSVIVNVGSVALS
ncbi:hypothetical protein LB543_04960 [Mesorhizobium sp. ESP7-2]|uniref:hypothetical protein n=1 Tax=Mesorhizobium sp. ESP7-2 TaxID=2876622 RepID=UPI001CCC72E7|nr:hypothetical protein [Mesorhizobium sp. ESP7-2]MBZ9706069.1 hypothetical protein [Mesorhizobium sp. ESP7-2]